MIPKVSDDTPCFFIKFRHYLKSEYERCGEKRFSSFSYYVDGTKEEAEKCFNNDKQQLLDGGWIIEESDLHEVDEYYRYQRRHPRKSVIANLETCDLRSF